jgi:hypothetical protein
MTSENHELVRGWKREAPAAASGMASGFQSVGSRTEGRAFRTFFQSTAILVAFNPSAAAVAAAAFARSPALLIRSSIGECGSR